MQNWIGVAVIATNTGKIRKWGKWLDGKLFSKEGSKLRSDYICPKCGSDNWKFPNPIKPSEHLPLNFYPLVNSLCECRDCWNIGILCSR